MKQYLKKIKEWFNEFLIEIDLRYFYKPYCKKCGGCGEEGCCSPTRCLREQKFNCKYGETYKKDLEFAYLMIDELYEIADKTEREKIHEKYWEKVYGEASKKKIIQGVSDMTRGYVNGLFSGSPNTTVTKFWKKF